MATTRAISLDGPLPQPQAQRSPAPGELSWNTFGAWDGRFTAYDQLDEPIGTVDVQGCVVNGNVWTACADFPVWTGPGTRVAVAGDLRMDSGLRWRLPITPHVVVCEGVALRVHLSVRLEGTA